MAIYTNLPVYKASYNLMLTLCRMMPNLPRDCRYSIGQETQRKMMDVIILIYNANRERNKISIIRKIQDAMLEVQVYVRLMNDMKYISEKKYFELIELIVSITKQMSAWERSEKNKKSGEEACGNVEILQSINGQDY